MIPSVLKRVCKDMITAADGETFAVGRVLGIILFFVGLAGPTGVAVYMMLHGAVSMAEWVSFLGALTGYVPMLCSAVAGLIWVTNRTEPDGRAPGEQSH